MTRKASALSLALLGALVAAFFWQARAEEDPIARQPTDLRQSALRSPEALDSEPGAEFASGGQSEASRQAIPAPSSSSLLLSIVDAGDGSHLAGMHYEVFSAGVPEQLLAQGHVDEHGQARLFDLPGRAIVIRTTRRPPHAPGFVAQDLAEQSTGEVELRVGHGGSIHGRVTDETGKPLAGVSLYSIAEMMGLAGDGGPMLKENVVAVTDKTGWFLAQHLLTHPVQIEFVDGKPRPQRWNPVYLKAESPFLPGTVGQVLLQLVAEGERVELPKPLVIRRARSLRGHVLNSRGEPAAGVFVSEAYEARASLRAGGSFSGAHDLTTPFEFGEEGFELNGWEAITDAAGAFQIELPSGQGYHILVVTPDGRSEGFEGTRDEPAAQLAADVLLQLRETRALRFLLQDAQGEPIQWEKWSAERANYYQTALICGLGRKDFLKAKLFLRSGEVEQHYLDRPSPEGLVKIVPNADPREIRALQLDTAHFLTVLRKFPSGIEPGSLHSIEVTPSRSLGLSIQVSTDPGRLAMDSFQLSIQACAASPSEVETSLHKPLAQVGLTDSIGCCGLGSLWSEVWDGQPLKLDMPVLTEIPYWVYVHGVGERQSLPFQVWGPFQPGSVRHEVLLDGAHFLEREAATARVIGQPNKGELFGRRASVVLVVVDSATGEVPRICSIQLEDDAGSRQEGFSLRENKAGLGAKTQQTGRFEFRLLAMGYRSVPLGSHELVLGRELQLGRVEMERAPLFCARLLDAAGEPLAQWTDVGIIRQQLRVGADGRLDALNRLPQAFPLCVRDSRQDRLQVVEVTQWSPAEVLDLQLPSLRQVDIRVHEVPSGYELARMKVIVAFQMQHGDLYISTPYAQFGPRDGSIRVPELPGVEAHVKHFRPQLGVGRYHLQLESRLFSIPSTEIEVVEGEGLQSFDVHASRRAAGD